MVLPVVFSRDAEADLEAVLAYVAQNDGPSRTADLVLALHTTATKLAHLPRRGVLLQELGSITDCEYRSLAHKPYRIVYEVTDARVVIHAILDGRRNVIDLLAQRLLR